MIQERTSYIVSVCSWFRATLNRATLSLWIKWKCHSTHTCKLNSVLYKLLRMKSKELRHYRSLKVFLVSNIYMMLIIMNIGHKVVIPHLFLHLQQLIPRMLVLFLYQTWHKSFKSSWIASFKLLFIENVRHKLCRSKIPHLGPLTFLIVQF